MAVLAHEGCPDLDRIGNRDYVLSEPSALEEDTAKVQVVKKLFLRKFWKVSGREMVREAAQQRLEAVGVLFSFYPFAGLISYGRGMLTHVLLFLCR